MKKYCVIGNPAKHSLSPFIHNKLYELYGINECIYETRELTSAELSTFIEKLAAEQIAGFNITMPYKKDIQPYLDELDPSAAYGVNTVVVKNSRLHGYSTDAAGFKKGLEGIGFSYKYKNIVFIGCGAVAQSLIQDAKQSGARKIVVVNRTLGHAQELADGHVILADSLSNLGKYMKNCNLLVNTTPLGMQGMELEFDSLSFLNLLPHESSVCDLIYHPAKTKLLCRANELGHKTLNGLPMLIWQAFFAFRYFLGIMPTSQDFDTIMGLIEARI
ncbi:shikimate dehydrogenase [Christensenellaceae bacterium OttesenSCG-928-K19]|nr:shikimate dehydrogenase [Christensenellaceae bacterium OttesenSCG-928-K19]